jgi:hypothetical protein
MEGAVEGLKPESMEPTEGRAEFWCVGVRNWRQPSNPGLTQLGIVSSFPTKRKVEKGPLTSLLTYCKAWE